MVTLKIMSVHLHIFTKTTSNNNQLFNQPFCFESVNKVVSLPCSAPHGHSSSYCCKYKPNEEEEVEHAAMPDKAFNGGNGWRQQQRQSTMTAVFHGGGAGRQ
jgi:hypothetical protein